MYLFSAGTVALFRVPSATERKSSTRLLPSEERKPGSQTGKESPPSKRDIKGDNVKSSEQRRLARAESLSSAYLAQIRNRPNLVVCELLSLQGCHPSSAGRAADS